MMKWNVKEAMKDELVNYTEKMVKFLFAEFTIKTWIYTFKEVVCVFVVFWYSVYTWHIMKFLFLWQGMSMEEMLPKI